MFVPVQHHSVEKTTRDVQNKCIDIIADIVQYYQKYFDIYTEEIIQRAPTSILLFNRNNSPKQHVYLRL